MSFLPESYDIPHLSNAVKEWIDVPALGTGVTTGKYYIFDRFVGSSRLGNDTAALLLAANTFTISTKAMSFFEDVT